MEPTNPSPLETLEPGPIQPSVELAPAPAGPWYEDRRTWGAIGQVILVCGIPTQVFLSLVVWAINEGRGAARECDRYLMGSTTLP